MRIYKMTTQFVIGDDENVSDVADKWLQESTKMYEHPSCQFDIVETITVRRSNDTTCKDMKP